MDTIGQIKTIILKINVLIFIVVTLFFNSESSFGQDIHFSQFLNAPLFHNAATTGLSDSDIRLNNIYRSQWRTIDNPYSSLQVSADGKTNILNRFIGIGGLLVHDNSSGSYLTTDQLFLSLSHSFFYKNHQISVGLQPGLVMKRYNKNNLTFGDQFNDGTGSFDPDIPSGDDDLNEKMNYFNLNVGVYWKTRIKKMLPGVGFAVQNVTRPIESFASDNTATERLALKYTLHGHVEIPISEKYALDPMLLFATSGTSRNFILGTNGSYFPANKNSAVSRVNALLGVRINPVRNVDALIIGAGVGIFNFDIGLSYDFNISQLSAVSNYQGAYEISLVYRVNRAKKNKHTEPCIIF